MITPVDYKTAVLLKEKGFDLPCRGRIHGSHFHLIKNNEIPKNVSTYYNEPFAPIIDWNNAVGEVNVYLSLPTITEVVMWLYEEHGIWIVVDNYTNEEDIIWFYNYKTKDRESMQEGYDSPTEAYMAAINYVLNKLIN